MSHLPRILVLGATGYIGGSVLADLIQRNPIDIPDYTLSALVRQPYQASILTDAGVNPLIFKDLDDVDVIREAAKDHDIVVAAASARHADCARACILGLSERQKETGRATHYIHTSGGSMVGDWPATGERVDTSIYSDVDQNIYEIERDFPDSHSPVRRVNQLVVELGEKEGVKTYIIPPPLIFGPGTGSFTTGIGQVHMMTQLALKKKQSVMIGSGSGIWSRIHILDLSNLFAALVRAIMDENPDLPSGKAGYYFTENGSQSWKYIAERIGQVGKGIGAFETDEIRDIELQEVADEMFHGDLRHAEGVLASNSRTKADRARKILGWSPKYGEEDFLEEIDEVVTTMFAQERT